ncbi:hypothetical protein ETH_00038725, partial [Eimeria tenella]
MDLPATSPEAFRFALDILEFEKKEKEKRNEEERKRERAATQQNRLVSDPKEVIGTADYGKFSRLSEQLKAEEAAEEESRRREAEAARALAAGCGHDHSKERQLYERPTLEKIEAAE